MMATLHCAEFQALVNAQLLQYVSISASGFHWPVERGKVWCGLQTCIALDDNNALEGVNVLICKCGIQQSSIFQPERCMFAFMFAYEARTLTYKIY